MRCILLLLTVQETSLQVSVQQLRPFLTLLALHPTWASGTPVSQLQLCASPPHATSSVLSAKAQLGWCQLEIVCSSLLLPSQDLMVLQQTQWLLVPYLCLPECCLDSMCCRGPSDAAS